MELDERQQAGFALAAAAHADRAAAIAARGLTEALRATATRLARELAAEPAERRRAWVRGVLAGRARPLAAAPPEFPERALALLAQRAERPLGRAWLERAPQPRAGYAPAAALVRLLHALALAARDEGSAE